MNGSLRGWRILKGALLAASSVVGFASTFVAGGVLTQEMHVAPAALSLLRFAIAGGVMLAVGLLNPASRKELFAPRGKDWLAITWLGIVGTVLMAWCVFMGCARVSSANASMADALSPLCIFLVGAIVSRKATAWQILGLVSGFAGALFVIQVFGPSGLALSAYGIGDAFILASAITWGVYSVFGRADISRLGSYAFTTWTMLAGCLALAVVIGATYAFHGISGNEFGLVWPHGLKAWGLTFFLGVFCTLMPFWTWNAAQNYLPLSVLGMTAYFTPVVAVLLAWAFIGEKATPWQWLGTLLICFSAVVESGRSHDGEGTV